MAERRRAALVSVSDKDGVVELVRELLELDFDDIYSTGGTAGRLAEAGIPVTDVKEIIGGGEILGGRVKSISREVHAGLISALERDEAEMEQLGLPIIDLVCCNFYPLKRTIATPGITEEEVIEGTDIGGPAMIRSAAKGRRIIVTRPADYPRVLEWLRAGEPDGKEVRREMAAEAEALVCAYTMVSAEYASGGNIRGMIGRKVYDFRYGENAWQTPAGLYAVETDYPLAIPRFQVLAGQLGLVNTKDVHRLIVTATHIAAGLDLSFGVGSRMAVGVKHGNACGACINGDPRTAIARMIAGDPLALFGGFVLTNFEVGAEEAAALLAAPGGGKQVLDGVVAAGFTEDAIELLSRREDRCKLLVNPALATLSQDSLDTAPLIDQVAGGFTVQPNYTKILDLTKRNASLEVIGDLSAGQARDVVFAWAVGSTCDSNTITIVRGGQLLGNGVGQKDRCIACQLAVMLAERSGHDLQDAVAYSDSFFPFNDGPLVLINAGVKVIFASSGSNNDEALKALCRERGITLILVPDKEIRGFFGH